MANVLGLPDGALAGDTDCWRHAREAWKMLRDLNADPDLAGWTDDERQSMAVGLLAGRFSAAMQTGQRMSDEDFASPSPTMGQWEV